LGGIIDSEYSTEEAKMIYFIVQVLVNTLALALTIAIVPGVSLHPLQLGAVATLLELLAIGALFGLVNTFVRPIILVLTGRLLLKSIGLLAIVINSLLFYLLAMSTAVIFVANNFVSILLAGILSGLFVALLEAILGLDTPILYASQNKTRFYWRWLGRLPGGLRGNLVENLRLQQSYGIIWRYGVAIALDQTPLRGVRRRMQHIIYPHTQIMVDENPQTAVRLMLQELGPTYVKMGQMAAGRSDILPESWVTELEKLQNEVAPFPYAEVEKRIIQELGAPPESVFATFDQEPLAAASTAQIHRATLTDGEIVVVKVQRPDINVTVRGDLNIMRDVIAKLERRSRWVREMGASELLEEFAESVLMELDYRNEAFNAQLLDYNMRSTPEVQVPTIYEAYSTRTVLTMAYVDGIKITEAVKRDDVTVDREQLARLFLRSMNKQVMLDGFFHADPHPGNVFVSPQQETIIFLDLGMMGALSAKQRMTLVNMVWSLRDGDSKNVAQAVLQMTRHDQNLNLRSFGTDVDRMVKRHLVFSDEIPQLSAVMEDVFILLSRYRLRLDREFALAMKSLMQTETTVTLLAPQLSFFDMAIDEIEGVFLAQLKGEALANRTRDQVRRTTKELIMRLPVWQEAASKWMTQLENGRFILEIDASDINQQMDGLKNNLDRNVRRLVITLILIGLLASFAIGVNAPVMANIPHRTAMWALSPLALMAVIALFYLGAIMWEAWRDR